MSAEIRATSEPVEHPVDTSQQVRRALLGVHRDTAQQAAHLSHRGGGLGVVADDVADDHDGVAGLQHERVVPVPADLRGVRSSLVADRDLETLGVRGPAEQAALEALGEVTLLGEEARVVDGQAGARGDRRQRVELLLAEVGVDRCGDDHDADQALPAAQRQRHHRAGHVGQRVGDQRRPQGRVGDVGHHPVAVQCGHQLPRQELHRSRAAASADVGLVLHVPAADLPQHGEAPVEGGGVDQCRGGGAAQPGHQQPREAV